ncbi:type VI secretion system membrane subunit TssM [Pseudomonas sp. SWRI107]|uniref:type VI secretion system membrane subunit TssM n=1 Tax=Pseudomonas farsensis TaxID=2745492 RepID=UPI001646A165|nr:type VI secretion system membrane subunit TssM [Pseudomonas farsensis]MBV4533929.1 type VI secretion system membrane subunit TssM [Pseudomonas farsensis]
MNQLWTLFLRWGLPLAGRVATLMPVLLAACAVLVLVAIWWLGPHWTWRGQQPLAAPSHRAVLSLALVLLVLAAWLGALRSGMRRLQAQRRRESELDDDPCLEFVHAQERALNRNLDHYLDNAGGGRALYRLPWYLVLGDAQAGKSSLVDRSEQCFSLTRIGQDQARVRGAVEQGHCPGWWVSSDAVIIDPPGEFISQGPSLPALPEGTQARLWEHLLGWLLRKRSRRALNGLLLVVDLPALLHAAPEQRLELTRVLRTRLHEVSSQLGSRLPLYVVLSKFDLLDGFEQLYGSMAAAQRRQLLGFTFTLDAVSAPDVWLDELDAAYDNFLHHLHEQVLEQMQAIDNAPGRARLLSLHVQLVGLRPVLANFLRETLASDSFTTPALVRGVYWSSVTQQGDMLNAFAREAAQPYGTLAPLREGKAQGKALVYFIQQVFDQVIYKEAGLAGDNVQVARAKRRLLWASCAVGLLACAVAVASWHRYFAINQGKAIGVLARSQEYSRHQVDQRLDPTGRNLLEPLDQIRAAVSVFGDYRAAWPLVADVGLYQGRVIGPRVDEAYLNLLSRRFLPALASGVVEQMMAAAPGSEQQLAALRVYRMIEDRRNRRAQWVEEWMATQWQAAFPGQGALQRDLMRHLKYALAYADADLAQYRQRVAQVQQVLRQVPLPQRVYAGLKQQASEKLYGALSVRQQVGPAFDVVYQPASDMDHMEGAVLLAPLLTGKGLASYFESRSQQFAEMAMLDQWVLGERDDLDYSDADRDALAERVRSIYSTDYVDSWRRALNAFEVVDFHGLDHAVAVLQQVTGPAAPLLRLLETVRDNTSLPRPALAEAAPSSNGVKATGAPEDVHAMSIRRAFSALNGMLQANAERPSYYDETLQAITAVHDYVKAVQDSPDRGKAALHLVLQRFSMTAHDPIGNLQRVASGLPDPVNRQVRKMADQTAQMLNIEALRELERRWDVEVYSFFQQRLAGRYPFVVRAPDASLDDFEAFFGPKGRLQQFHDSYLKVFLKDNLEALQASQQGTSLIRSDVIEQLELAEQIRETFFDQRGNLSVQFSIEPLGLSTNQRTSLLDLDGQLISYTHGTGQITGVVWPNTQGQQVRSSLTLLRLNGTSSNLEYRGPWSLFRLLSRGSLNGRTASSVDLSFHTADGAMRYRLSSEKAFNPITQQPFKGFRLPRGLLQQPPALAEAGQLDL